MELDLIFDIIKNWGVGGTTILAIILWILDKTIKMPPRVVKFFDRVIDFFLKRRVTNVDITQFKSIKESDVTNHDIFNYIDFWTYSKIPTFKFATEYRTVVFRKYLTIFLKQHKINLKSWIEEKKFSNMDDSELWTSSLALINKIIYDYESEMRSQGIPEVVIEKMKVRNNESISLTIDLLESICSSQFYTSEKNLLKIYSILNILLSILESTISSSLYICNSINGQLRGLTMDGHTEP
jgi:hypothetical protein